LELNWFFRLKSISFLANNFSIKKFDSK
jgi:hypothetical protein